MDADRADRPRIVAVRMLHGVGVDDQLVKGHPSRVRVLGGEQAAVAEGDVQGLVRLLDPDVVWTSDDGGVVTAARRPIMGALRVARAWIALARAAPGVTGQLIDVNGLAALRTTTAEGARSLMAFTLDAGRITRIDVIRNPTKLERINPLTVEASREWSPSGAGSLPTGDARGEPRR